MTAMTAEETLSRFAQAIRNVEAPIPAFVSSWNTEQPARRFGVYRDNVLQGLIDALAARYPVTERLVGAQFFGGMARAFLEVHPPRSPVLLEWGEDLAEFAAAFPPASVLPYLPEVIRLETAKTRAYHAEDVAPLGAADLEALSPGQLADLRLVAHPSLGLVRSAYPIASIVEMHEEGKEPDAALVWMPESVLVTRPALRVELRRLPAGAAVFMQGLAEGGTLGEAFVSATASDASFDAAWTMRILLESGAFTGRKD